MVGCIPYKIITVDDFDGNSTMKMEMLMVTPQRCHGLLFPKEGREDDENKEHATSWEALEKYGVKVTINYYVRLWDLKKESQWVVSLKLMTTTIPKHKVYLYVFFLSSMIPSLLLSVYPISMIFSKI